MADQSLPQASMVMPGAAVYSQQANPAFEAEMAARTASHEAAFLLPYLRRGMQLLDVGCGPGSITLGLAEIVAPGQVVGIDIQAAQVEQARAAAHGIATVRFEVADLYALPFPDASFDGAFANGVLMHLREPVRALAELRRVLRPGGIAGVRDPDLGASLCAPTTPLLEQWLAMRVQVRQHNGGDPFMSRHYRRFLLEAGFTHAEASASVESAGSREGTHRHAAFLKGQLQGFARTVVTAGWMEQATLDAVVGEIDVWAQRPDAFSATIWCEAVGWVSD
jgi:ubiquinone/menaquinone biosynthesis C-methylase UbiE